MDHGVPHSKLFHDVPAHGLGGGGRESQHRQSPEAVLESRQVPVRRPEIVAPVADAVGLVHGDQAQIEALQERPDAQLDALGCCVDELVLAAMETLDALAGAPLH